MVSEFRPEFENLETGRAVEHAFIYGNGPTVEGADENRGLVLTMNRRDYLTEFCTRVTSLPDNFPTNRPKNTPLANTITHQLLEAGRLSLLPKWLVPSVHSCNDIIKYAYPKWRHTSDIVQRHYHQRALRQLAEETGCELRTLNINISPKLGSLILKNGGCGYFFERLSLKLKRALGHTPLMWLILEAVTTETKTNPKSNGKGPVSQTHGVLHAHGAIALNDGELRVLKRVVRDLNESYSQIFKNNEFESKLITDDAYRVEYCNKHRLLNRMLLNGLNSYSRSKVLATRAKQLYDSNRSKFKILWLNNSFSSELKYSSVMFSF